MLKPLTLEGRVEMGIDEMFKDKLWAYTAVVTEHGYGLGIAVENEPGYNPVPHYWVHGDNWNEMHEHADALNRERNMTALQAAHIVASSMRGQGTRRA